MRLMIVLFGFLLPQISMATNLLGLNAFLIGGIASPFICQKRRLQEMPQNFRRFDLVALSEVFDYRSLKFLTSKLKTYFPHQFYTANLKGKFKKHDGLIILSKYPLSKKKAMLFKNKSGKDRKSFKGAIYAEVEREAGERFGLLVTHLQAFNSEEDISTRHKQFQELAGFIELVHAGSLPLLIVGDMNTPEKRQEQYERMLELLGNVRDIYKEKAVKVGPTFDSETNPLAWGGFSDRIDYIFSKDPYEKLDIKNAGIEKLPLVNSSRKCRYLSDHFGVTVSF